MTMNKNSNTYQILYSAIMVIVVGVLLAFVYMTLKPKQDMNVANDTRSQILGALNVSTDDLEGKGIEEKFGKYITKEYLVDVQGNVVDTTKNVAFSVNLKQNVKLDVAKRKLPVFEATLDDGSVKYVIPCYGAGLWGPIWGYVALDADGKTVIGTNFSHESETPGLGAKITESQFKDEFKGKHIYVEGAFKSIEVMKKGQKSVDGAETVDAISGATITSRGVSNMIKDCLAPYDAFFKKLQSSTVK